MRRVDAESLMATVDWSASPLGAPARWPESLHTTIRLMLKAEVQIVLFWGPEFVALYNDIYAPSIGDKHPRAFGRPAIENWGELWDDLEPLLRGVRETGRTFTARDRPFYIERHGYGETTYWDVSYSVVPEADGSVGGVLCIVSETTERVRSTATLRESEARQRFLLDLADSLRAISEPKSIIAASTRALGERLRSSRLYYSEIDEAVDRIHVQEGWRDGADAVTAEVRLSDHESPLLDRLRAGKTVRLDDFDDTEDARSLQALRAAGIRAAVVVPLVVGGRLRATLNVYENAQRRWSDDDIELIEAVAERTWEAVSRARAEAALRQLNDELARQVAETTAERDTAWRNARDMIVIVGRDAVFHAVSPSVTPILGWSIEDLVGRSVFDFIHPDDQAFTRENLADAFDRVLPPTENHLRHKDGSWRLISWITTPEREVMYAYGRDVTEERAKAGALAAAQAQLHEMQKMETLGQLTGGVAHDFNNLLTPIVGALDLLSRRLDGDERASRLIDGGLQAAERARILVQRLLAFSRRQHLEAKAVNVCKLFTGMSEILSRSLGPQIRLENHCPDILPSVLVDPNQLELALLNLAVNARDAMPDGGTLCIQAATERLEGPTPPAGDYVRIEVRDTGIGMDAEILKRAVEPFFTTKAVGKGTGLGLSSVHGLAAQSGGDFALRSEPGHGTTASLWLPVAERDEDVSSAAVESSWKADGEATVLLVDDEDLARAGTAEMLAEAGYVVVDVGSGLEALLKMRVGLKFDVLVTDFAMADMSGVELARRIRQLRPGLPVLMITGFADLDELRADGLPRLAKPFREPELARALAAVLKDGPSSSTISKSPNEERQGALDG